MNHQPLVTIGIATYNRPVWMKEAIESVLNQTYQNLEIIISDNCSEDPDVEKICREYVQKDSRIKYFRQAKNIGAAKNGQFHCQKATGTYYLGLADDDRIDPTYIEKTLQALLKDKKAVGCWTEINFMDENGNNIKIPNYIKYDTPDCSSNNYVNNFIAWSMQYGWYGTFLMKTDVIQAIDFSYKNTWGEDVLMINQLLLEGKILKINEPLFNYRTRQTNCYEYFDYKNMGLNEYSTINPYADSLLKIFELGLDTKSFNLYDKLNFYFTLWYKILFIDSTWIETRIKLFPILEFFNLIQKKKDFKSLFILFPLVLKFGIQKTKKKIKQLKKGLKAKFKVLKFINSTPRKSVLIIEPNICHGILLQARAKNYLQLGYSIDIIMSMEIEKEDPLCNFKEPNTRVLALPYQKIINLFKNRFIKNYDFLILNSSFDYRKEDLFFNLYDIKYRPKKEILVYEHDFENICKYKQEIMNNIKIIQWNNRSNLQNIIEMQEFYLGSIKPNILKAEKTIFAVPGCSGKTFKYLLDAINSIIKNEYTNFEVIIIGHIDMDKNRDIINNETFKKYITLTGRIDFEKMYQIVESSHFFIPLLNAKDTGSERYLNNAISGSLHMSIGALKPLLIQEDFVNFFKLNSSVCLIHNTAEELSQAMQMAMDMDSNKYQKMQEEIKKLANKFEQNSLSKIKSME